MQLEEETFTRYEVVALYDVTTMIKTDSIGVGIDQVEIVA